ncbi:MAG: tetratricopeptide repeat protein [Bacteroidota bacterium]
MGQPLKLVFSLLIAVLLAFEVYSQDNAERDIAFEKVDSLINLCRKNFFTDTEYARELATDADDILSRFSDPAREAKIQNLYGITYDIQGNTDSSRHYFTKFYQKSLELGDLVSAGNALNNLGMSNWNSGRFDLALDYFFSSLNIADSLDDQSSKGKSFNNIGLIYQELNDYPRSIEYHRKALGIREELSSPEIPQSYNNIGICLNHLGYPDSALFYYQEGLELLNDREGKIKADLLHNMGNVYLEKGQLERAETQCKLALDNSTSALGALLVHSTLSQIYFLKREPVNSIKSGLTALAYADSLQTFGHL